MRRPPKRAHSRRSEGPEDELWGPGAQVAVAEGPRGPPGRFSWDPWEREAWRPPPEETIDQWAERVVILPRIVSSAPGPLDLSPTHYLREILQAYTDPETEEITICSSTQVGKTTVGILVGLHSLKVDPWNMLHVMPRDQDAWDICLERYTPIIEESPELWALFKAMPEGVRRTALSRHAIRANGMTLRFNGAASPAALASRSIRTLIQDELDKWPPWSGEEADPVELARERLRTYWNRKRIAVSTPTTERGYIWRELLTSTHERYWVPCPRCGVYQELVWNTSATGPGIHWPKDVPIEAIRKDRLAWYECRDCGGRILDADKREMVRQGRWCPTGSRVHRDGSIEGPAASRRHRGFHLWAAYSPWLTFGEIAAKFLESKDEPAKLQNFLNSWLAQPWRVTVQEVRAASVRQCRAPYVEGQVPEGGWYLTAGVDVQAIGDRTRLYGVLRAWGQEARSWLVRAFGAESWEGVESILFRSAYRIPTGEALPLRQVCVDSGYRTDEVYQWCLRTSSTATKGASYHQKKPYNRGSVDAGGGRVQLILFDPGQYKEKLHRLIRGKTWAIPTDVAGEYYDHLAAEQLISERDPKSGRERLVWRVIPEGAPNHYFDAEVLALLAVDLLEAYHLTEPPDSVPKTIQVPPGAEAPAPMGRVSIQTFRGMYD